ncbi:hypothetical protein KRIGEM_03050 (plasmid) [Komagataeibacter rhaeticus]|nr:hypothetical protein KRIGEM_03050 [Komagataeibacter rhaeticus]
MFVRRDDLPQTFAGQTVDAGQFLNTFQLLLTSQIIPNIIKQDTALFLRIWILDHEGNGNRRPASSIEYFSAFLA